MHAPRHKSLKSQLNDTQCKTARQKHSWIISVSAAQELRLAGQLGVSVGLAVGGPTLGTRQAFGHHLCGLQNAEQSSVERSSECILECGVRASWQK